MLLENVAHCVQVIQHNFQNSIVLSIMHVAQPHGPTVPITSSLSLTVIN